MSRSLVLVSAGAGPAEVRRFAGKLAARIAEACEAAGLRVVEVTARGDEAAPRSVELLVEGDAAAALAGEEGTHALVARSEARGRGDRKRWFAAVSLHPVVAGAAPEIEARDLVVVATTAGGPGGQHVNKVATAVRVRHAPSGVTVRATEERSQRANLGRATARIAEILAGRAAAERAVAEAARRMAHHGLTRGAPVRAYRLGRRGELVVCG